MLPQNLNATNFFCVVGVCLLLSIVWIDAHPTNRKNDIQRHRLNRNKNLVTSDEKAQEILQRYGYLRCRLPRRRRQSEFSRSLPKSLPLCSHGDVKEAVRIYQRRHKLNVTGKLSNETLAFMSKSRCGNPDIEDSPASSSSSSHSLEHISRFKRNLLEYRKSSFRKVNRNLNENSSFISEKKILPRKLVSSRRYTWMKERIRQILKGGYNPIVEEESRKRRRRSLNDVDTEPGEAFFQDLITWRLLKDGYSNQLSEASQRAALALAFRMWSEVIPPMFVEDKKSHVNDVDILIYFDKGEHMSCPNSFDGFGGQLSHAIKVQGTSQIHVDDDEHFTIYSKQGTDLLKVAVHEIGHVLGLHHSSLNQSIMYAIYSQSVPTDFEIEWNDRKMIQEIYGVCRGQFDIIFDWVRRKPDGKFIFNTYLFREDRYWMYENRYNRTRYGDPLAIEHEWHGLPSHLDSFAHIWSYTMDRALFFKGSKYWLYDSAADRVAAGYPRNISDDFKSRANTNFPSIPNNIDAVSYDKRDGNLYFFKNEKVYAYDVSKGTKGCCLDGYPKLIREEFPPFSGSEVLTGNIDSAYYSIKDRTMYLFKGAQYWVNVGFNVNDRTRRNLLLGPYEINEKWFDVCDVESPNR